MREATGEFTGRLSHFLKEYRGDADRMSLTRWIPSLLPLYRGCLFLAS